MRSEIQEPKGAPQSACCDVDFHPLILPGVKCELICASAEPAVNIHDVENYETANYHF